MNSSALTIQRFNTLFFAIALPLALLLWGVSAFMVHKTLTTGGDQSLKAVHQSCISLMREKGFNPQIKGGTVTVVIAAAENIESLVSQAGVIVASCPTLTLNEFCAGSSCKIPGLTMTLARK